MIRRKKTALLLIAGMLLGLNSLQAQEQQMELNLQAAREYALEHNWDLQTSALDIDKARYQVKESITIGLPQVDASIGYNDNMALPVQLVPGDFFGQPGQDVEIKFGTKYNASLSGSINQLLFSGSYIVGLQASKAFLQQSKKQYRKNKIDVIKSVSEAYFMVLATEEGIAVIDSTLEITRKLAEETRIIFDNGFAEETDVDQLELLISELEVGRVDALSQLEIALAYLKLNLGLNNEAQLELEENLDDLVEASAAQALLGSNFQVSKNIDFQILKNQQDLALLQVKLEKSSYLPTLSAFVNYQTQAQRTEWDFFNASGKWFGSSVFGVNMNIPIFSSGQRHAKVKQAQFDLEKTRVAEQQLKSSLEIQYETTLKDYQNALLNFDNTRKNKAIAEKIFRRTGIKYREGVASSIDLLNTHNQFLNAQSQYINAALQVLNMNVSLESLLADGYEN
ncbi:MAG: TolC family protein [Bacteroidetes bacterium]|nr:TolC family protein [Bacteroidota bacterium]MBU1578749.1 TolC family protein [Bacteroidota bacterium]MBU2464797.1 TolC family protein [Bacteroidota bacterium]MBU2558280.1 TolC family protein [Bacteroidota bacterium]MDA3942059.1 TolC family protein [Bacteroidota bacterium]